MRTRFFSAGRPSPPPSHPSPSGRGVHGFTLIELILVLVIISIAFAIVAPAIGNRFGGSDPKRNRGPNSEPRWNSYGYKRSRMAIEQRLVIDPEDNQYWQGEAGRQVAARDGQRGGVLTNEDEQITSSE